MKDYFNIVDRELECSICGNIFPCNRKRYYDHIQNIKKLASSKNLCPKCLPKVKESPIPSNCGNCNKDIFVFPRDLRKSKSGKCFCSQSCGATYNNKNKSYGIRRSKLEKFVEQAIRDVFPNLEMKCNSKTEIGSELDFYFPSLKLGIEINGIYHYEPIHGKDKLTRIQNNDQAKLRACDEKGIDLIIIPNPKYMNNQDKEEFRRNLIKIISDR